MHQSRVWPDRKFGPLNDPYRFAQGSQTGDIQHWTLRQFCGLASGKLILLAADQKNIKTEISVKHRGTIRHLTRKPPFALPPCPDKNYRISAGDWSEVAINRCLFLHCQRERPF